MFTIILSISVLVAAYIVVRYFIKNKEARAELAEQVKGDAAKVKKDLTKIIEKKKKK